MSIVRAAYRVELELSPGVWTNVTLDVSRADTIQFKRGITGSGPLDRVASTGTFEWSMKNGPDGVTPSRPLGYYSPNNVNVRAGFNTGIGVRLIATYLTIDYSLWTGKLRTATPIPGAYRERRSRCLAYDGMNDLAENDVQSIPPQIGQTENALVAAILAALPAAAQPSAVTYDASLDTYAYALDNASTGVKAMSLLTDVILSAQAYLFPLADGTLHLQNRHTRPLSSVMFAFDDSMLDSVDIPTDFGNVYDRVRTLTHPRTLDGAATTVLFAITSAQIVNPGDTVTIWGDYAQSTNSLKLIGGTAQVTPLVSGTDYSGNSAADGSGADLTSSLSIVVSAFAATVKFEVTNVGAQPVYLVDATGAAKLQIRGKGIYDNAPVSFESGTGARLLEIDLRYQDNGEVAQDLADFVRAQYASLNDQVVGVTFNPQKSSALMVQALSGEIGNVITVTEAITGVSAVAAVIQGIEGTIVGGPHLKLHYVTAPRGPSSMFILDDATFGVLDSPVGTLGYA